MPPLPDPTDTLARAVEKAGSVADLGRFVGLDEKDVQRLYRAASGKTKIMGADLYLAALSFLIYRDRGETDGGENDNAAPAAPQASDPRPAYEAWKIKHPRDTSSGGHTHAGDGSTEEPSPALSGYMIVVDAPDGTPWLGYRPTPPDVIQPLHMKGRLQPVSSK